MGTLSKMARDPGSSALLVKQSQVEYTPVLTVYTILPVYSQNGHCRPAWHVPRVACRVPYPGGCRFHSTTYSDFLGPLLADRMTLSLQGWHLDETAAQLTLQVTTRARVRCPCARRPLPGCTAAIPGPSPISRGGRILYACSFTCGSFL